MATLPLKMHKTVVARPGYPQLTNTILHTVKTRKGRR